MVTTCTQHYIDNHFNPTASLERARVERALAQNTYELLSSDIKDKNSWAETVGS
jgi:hypothetical protein